MLYNILKSSANIPDHIKFNKHTMIEMVSYYNQDVQVLEINGASQALKELLSNYIETESTYSNNIDKDETCSLFDELLKNV